VLTENAHAIKVFHQLGATTHAAMGHELELTIDLTEPARATPALRELLRAVASGVLEPARSIWELWLRQRPPPDGFGEAIVVGIDGTAEALIAADRGRELARTLGLPVHLVAAYRPLLDDRGAIESSLREGERRLRDAGVEVTVKAGRGDPAFAILYAAMRARAGLIVLGSPPPPESSPILGSSVWNAVAHNSHCSVLIARAPRGG
jgi:nucleotide-binding universal stress UspA family protein